MSMFNCMLSTGGKGTLSSSRVSRTCSLLTADCFKLRGILQAATRTTDQESGS